MSLREMLFHMLGGFTVGVCVLTQIGTGSFPLGLLAAFALSAIGSIVISLAVPVEK